LHERGLTADFFVNPVNAGRPGFASWMQLREMSDAGMSVQSHGYTHTYFTHHDTPALRDELVRSKNEIEQRVGKPVTLLAPPGGRCPSRLEILARECGYEAVLDSVPGVFKRHAAPGRLPRVAITAGHQADEVVHWAKGGDAALRRHRLRYHALALAKRTLGDSRYERVRTALLGGPTA
jgi:peptidoglycan/xylan/chitin deacetylase (PgdA/CDA1 family)